MLLMYQFIIMLSPIYNNFTFGPIENIGWSNRGTVATIGPFCNFFFNNFFSKFINDFLVINSLLLKIKYKLYVSTLFTSIPFVFAFIFKFIVRGPNPGNSPLLDIFAKYCAVAYFNRYIIGQILRKQVYAVALM